MIDLPLFWALLDRFRDVKRVHIQLPPVGALTAAPGLKSAVGSAV